MSRAISFPHHRNRPGVCLYKIYIPGNGVDLIVCNFAFHYFISDKKSLLNVIKFVNYYLKAGGRFIFTAFDGKSIINLMKRNNGDWTIKKGNDIKDYEGTPIKIDEFKKDAVYIDDNDDEIIEETFKEDELDIYYNNYYEIYTDSLEQIIKKSNIIIGSIYRFGSKASTIITDRLLELVPDRSIIMDVAIDQGGITSQSKATTIDNPVIKYKNASIYCVPNIPCQVPHKASNELSKVVVKYIKKIINDEIDDEIKGGIFMINGVIN